MRLVAIIPWFTVLFGAITAVVLFLASSRVSRQAHRNNVSDIDEKREGTQV